MSLCNFFNFACILSFILTLKNDVFLNKKTKHFEFLSWLKYDFFWQFHHLHLGSLFHQNFHYCVIALVYKKTYHGNMLLICKLYLEQNFRI